MDLETKIALKIATEGTHIASVLQHGSTKASYAFEILEQRFKACLELLESHDSSDEIYALMGDQLESLKSCIQDLEEGLNIVSYVGIKLQEKKLRSKIPAQEKSLIDTTVAKDV